MPWLLNDRLTKRLGFGAGGLGIFGTLLLASGLCLPCVLAPLGILGAVIFLLVSFIASNTWLWIILLALSLFVSYLSNRFGSCSIDPVSGKKLYFTKSAKVRLAFGVVIIIGFFVFSLFNDIDSVQVQPHCSSHNISD